MRALSVVEGLNVLVPRFQPEVLSIIPGGIAIQYVAIYLFNSAWHRSVDRSSSAATWSMTIRTPHRHEVEIPLRQEAGGAAGLNIGMTVT